MTIPLTGTGGLFTRVGAMGGCLNDINSFVGTANLTAANIKSIGPAIDAIQAQFQAADQNLTTSLYSNRDTYRQVHGQLQSALQSLAQATVIQMANDDTPLAQLTLTLALQTLIAQMKAASASVQKPTISATPTAGGSNVGSGVLAVSVLGSNGVQRDYIFNETITATCTADGQGTGTAGQETFAFTGPAVESNPLTWDWPLGSGINTSLNAVDALQDNLGGNLLQNGSFKQWTNPTIGPDNWLILDPGAGVGTTIVQASGSNVYKGTSGIGFVGDGTHTPSIAQPFGATLSTAGNAGGTTATLSPSTQYALNLFLKASVVPAAGVLTIELTDGANNVVNDAAGTPNSLAITLSGITTSFVGHQVFFRTPAVNPSTGYRLRIRISTAVSSGSTIYFGHTGLQTAQQLYTGGPYAGLFSGATNFILADTFSLAVSNNYGSAWQKLAERLFSMRALGLQLPSSGTPTVADSLIA